MLAPQPGEAPGGRHGGPPPVLLGDPLKQPQVLGGDRRELPAHVDQVRSGQYPPSADPPQCSPTGPGGSPP